jgi:FdhD protein
MALGFCPLAPAMAGLNIKKRKFLEFFGKLYFRYYIILIKRLRNLILMIGLLFINFPKPGGILNDSLKHNAIYWENSSNKTTRHNLISEEPLSIRVQGNPYSVVMRTPGDEMAHVAGFCLGEGIVDTPDDFTSIGFCEDDDNNVITVTLRSSRRKEIPQILERRGFISQTSCGLCGKEIVKDLYQTIQPVNNDIRIDIHKALNSLKNLSVHQPLREKTRASHAAVLYDADFEMLAVAEDVGRHNALDKAIGKVFLQRKLDQVALTILSSRISYELVQKAARAKLPIIFAHSRPTALAVELASQLNITLASLDDDDKGLYVFCGHQRILP